MTSIFRKTIGLKRKYILIIMDIFVIIIANLLTIMLLQNNLNIFAELDIKNIQIYIIIYISVYELFLWLFDVYNNITRYENGNDYLIYMFICLISFAVMGFITIIFKRPYFNLRHLILSNILIITGIISYRVIIRLIVMRHSNNGSAIKQNMKKNLLIIGSNIATRDIIKTINERMQNEYNIVGILDEDKSKIGNNISGIKIIGLLENLEGICEEKKVETIFFTLSNLKASKKREILNRCQLTGAKIRVLSSTENIIKGKDIINNLRDLKIEDVLCRETVELDNNNISNIIKENVIMVTGGGGSIGSELCRQIMKYGPKKLIIVDIYENNLYDIQMELESEYEKERFEAIVASVRDEKRMEYIFDKYRPILVFHAAAHKHVPLMENSPLEAIKNNVFGTYTIAQCCDKYNIKKMILISTDKAVNPTNIMGASKRICEMIIQAKNKESKTEFAAVRFGNVLGSNGSVIPLFKKQIEKGGPITLTDKRITRFFMTISEAVSLVLQAMTYAKGGEIFALDMGQPVRIYDLAVNLIHLSGLEPNIDIKIDIIGLRPGEKLYEELLMSEEGLTSTAHKKIFIAKPTKIDMKKIEIKLDKFRTMIQNEDCDLDHVKEKIKGMVNTYIASNEVDGVTK